MCCVQGPGLGGSFELGHGSVGNAVRGTRQSRASRPLPLRRESLSDQMASKPRPEARGMLRGSDEVPIGGSGKGSYVKDVTFELGLKAWR